MHHECYNMFQVPMYEYFQVEFVWCDRLRHFGKNRKKKKKWWRDIAIARKVNCAFVMCYLVYDAFFSCSFLHMSFGMLLYGVLQRFSFVLIAIVVFVFTIFFFSIENATQSHSTVELIPNFSSLLFLFISTLFSVEIYLFLHGTIEKT